MLQPFIEVRRGQVQTHRLLEILHLVANTFIKWFKTCIVIKWFFAHLYLLLGIFVRENRFSSWFIIKVSLYKIVASYHIVMKSLVMQTFPERPCQSVWSLIPSILIDEVGNDTKFLKRLEPLWMNEWNVKKTDFYPHGNEKFQSHLQKLLQSICRFPVWSSL